MSDLSLIPVGDAAAKHKRRKPLKTTALTRAFYERRGYRVAFVERFVERPIPGTDRMYKVKFDAWGFADHLMFVPGQPGMRAVNSCGMTGGALAQHVTDILANPRAYEFLQDPNNRIGVMGWKHGERGKKSQYKYRAITLEMFVNGKPPEPEKKSRRRKDTADPQSSTTPAEAKESIRCRHCGVIRRDQVGWSLQPDVCAVCSMTNNPPSETRLRVAEELNAARGEVR